MIKSFAVLKYDPNRGEDFRKKYKTRTLIAQRPFDDLDLYYQWLFRKQFGEKFILQRPMFGTHVTIVSGNETVIQMQNWKKYQNEKVEFEIIPSLRRIHQFWYVDVKSVQFGLIRQELGLSFRNDFHITIGRLYDWQM